ncbi:MAG: pyruvate kinase [Patescibacteria group bacterium]|jgi:pyruvate kinase
MYIVATISKNSYPAEKIEEILKAGATMLRFNFSHGTPQDQAGHIQTARTVIAKLGLEKSVKIIADLPGDKLRLGTFEPIHFPIKKGQLVKFVLDYNSDDPSKFIPIDADNICKYLKAGQPISVGDGDPALIITEIIDENTFTALVQNNGGIQSMKGFNIGRGVDELDHFTKKTLESIAYLPKIKPDLIALSFVNNRAYLKKAKKLLAEQYHSDKLPPLVAKLETPEAIKNLDEIAKDCDIFMVARGDLAITAPYEMLGIYQKQIVQAAKRNNKQVIVATQLLESLMESHTPTRSEILDLTNIVLDGADGIMFAKETGLSLTPGYSVSIAKKIINAVEKNRDKI